MNRSWWWVAIALWLAAWPAYGETVHLKTGETIKGKIVKADEQSITIESSKGFGAIQVDRGDITLIEFDEKGRDPSRTIGLGYYHRANPNTASGRVLEYGVDALSLKYWISDKESLEFQVGFFNTTESNRKVLEVFSLAARYAQVFKRQSNLDLYWGGSAGYLNVVDNTGDGTFSASGTAFRAFLGAEIFFVTLPNLGISAEVGAGVQNLGSRSTADLSATTFPSFSMRYYF